MAAAERDRFTSPAIAAARFVAQRMILKPVVWTVTKVTVLGKTELDGPQGRLRRRREPHEPSRRPAHLRRPPSAARPLPRRRRGGRLLLRRPVASRPHRPVLQRLRRRSLRCRPARRQRQVPAAPRHPADRVPRGHPIARRQPRHLQAGSGGARRRGRGALRARRHHRREHRPPARIQMAGARAAPGRSRIRRAHVRRTGGGPHRLHLAESARRSHGSPTSTARGSSQSDARPAHTSLTGGHR